VHKQQGKDTVEKHGSCETDKFLLNLGAFWLAALPRHATCVAAMQLLSVVWLTSQLRQPQFLQRQNSPHSVADDFHATSCGCATHGVANDGCHPNSPYLPATHRRWDSWHMGFTMTLNLILGRLPR